MNSTVSVQKSSKIEIPAKETNTDAKVPEFSGKTTSNQQPMSAVPKHTVDEETIRLRAYEIYVHRGSHDGNHETDWLEAEEQLRNEK